jgi:hypothetical protein
LATLKSSKDSEKFPLTIGAGSLSLSGTPAMMTGRYGISLAIPLPFLLTGACASALFGLLLPLIAPEAIQSPGFPHVLVLVHIATLGWLTMTIMGASLQLTPVIVVSPLRATRFVNLQYPVYLSGVAILLSGFWWMTPWLMAVGGTMIVLAVINYVVMLGATLAHSTARPLTVRYLIASLIYLCVVVSLGLTAALDFQFDFLGTAFDQLLLTHLTLGILGWLSSMLIGVSYTLARMFALTHGHTDRLGRFIFVLLNVSTVGIALGFIFSWYLLILLAGTTLVASAWLFVYDFFSILRSRYRKVLDVTQYHSIVAVAYFSLVVPFGFLVAIAGWWQPAVLVALGLAVFVGWLGQSITGYLYKIVPFLVWQSRYGPLVGRQHVPLMRDLLHERWAWASFWLINFGLIAAVITALLQWVWPLQIASGLLGIGMVIAAANIIGVVRHLHSKPSLRRP